LLGEEFLAAIGQLQQLDTFAEVDLGCLLMFGNGPVDDPLLGPPLSSQPVGSDLNAARISSAKMSGCSHAAK
jgi:hypothetical protein